MSHEEQIKLEIEVGMEIIKLLFLKPTISGKFNTAYGAKTPQGIRASVLLIIETEKARQDLNQEPIFNNENKKI